MNEVADPQDQVAFRRVLGHFATGLTIVTAMADEKPVGMTCQSFASVSLDPPLVSFFARQESWTWAAIKASGKFCANILADHQENLARIFAIPGADKFKDAEYQLSPGGSPILGGGVGWIDCEIAEVFAAGDHDGILGRVTGLAHESNDMPLIYFRGGYGTFQA